MSIDLNFVALTADVLEIFFYKINGGKYMPYAQIQIHGGKYMPYPQEFVVKYVEKSVLSTRNLHPGFLQFFFARKVQF